MSLELGFLSFMANLSMILFQRFAPAKRFGITLNICCGFFFGEKRSFFFCFFWADTILISHVMFFVLHLLMYNPFN